MPTFWYVYILIANQADLIVHMSSAVTKHHALGCKWLDNIHSDSFRVVNIHPYPSPSMHYPTPYLNSYTET